MKYFLLLLLLSSSIAANIRFAVLNLNADESTIHSGDLVALTDYMSTLVDEIEGISVSSWDDKKNLLQHIQYNQLIGCDEDECLTEIGGTLGVDFLLSGNIGKIGEIYMVTLKIIDIQKCETVARTTEKVDGGIENLITIIPKATYTVVKTIPLLKNVKVNETKLTNRSKDLVEQILVDKSYINEKPVDRVVKKGSSFSRSQKSYDDMQTVIKSFEQVELSGYFGSLRNGDISIVELDTTNRIKKENSIILLENRLSTISKDSVSYWKIKANNLLGNIYVEYAEEVKKQGMKYYAKNSDKEELYSIAQINNIQPKHIMLLLKASKLYNDNIVISKQEEIINKSIDFSRLNYSKYSYLAAESLINLQKLQNENAFRYMINKANYRERAENCLVEALSICNDNGIVNSYTTKMKVLLKELNSKELELQVKPFKQKLDRVTYIIE